MRTNDENWPWELWLRLVCQQKYESGHCNANIEENLYFKDGLSDLETLWWYLSAMCTQIRNISRRIFPVHIIQNNEEECEIYSGWKKSFYFVNLYAVSKSIFKWDVHFRYMWFRRFCCKMEWNDKTKVGEPCLYILEDPLCLLITCRFVRWGVFRKMALVYYNFYQYHFPLKRDWRNPMESHHTSTGNEVLLTWDGSIGRSVIVISAWKKDMWITDLAALYKMIIILGEKC